MAREDPQLKIRLPEHLKSMIEAAALANGRSMNAEIIARLEVPSGPDDATRAAVSGLIEEAMRPVIDKITAALSKGR